MALEDLLDYWKDISRHEDYWEDDIPENKRLSFESLDELLIYRSYCDY